MDKDIDTAFYRRQIHEFLCTSEFDKGVVLCKRLITMNPKSQRDHFCWARIRGDQKKYRLSELKFREVTILNPRDYPAFNSLGIALSKQGKYEQAISSYKKGLEFNKIHLDLTYNVAIAYTKKGDYKEAAKWCERSLKKHPNNEFLHNWMGYLYLLQDKYKEAIQKFDDAIQRYPGYEVLYFNKALVLFCQNVKEEEVEKVFEIGIEVIKKKRIQKKRQFVKAPIDHYSSEMSRVGKELECLGLECEARENLEKIQKGFSFVLNLLRIEIEKFEN